MVMFMHKDKWRSVDFAMTLAVLQAKNGVPQSATQLVRQHLKLPASSNSGRLLYKLGLSLFFA